MRSTVSGLKGTKKYKKLTTSISARVFPLDLLRAYELNLNHRDRKEFSINFVKSKFTFFCDN